MCKCIFIIVLKIKISIVMYVLVGFMIVCVIDIFRKKGVLVLDFLILLEWYFFYFNIFWFCSYIKNWYVVCLYLI